MNNNKTKKNNTKLSKTGKPLSNAQIKKEANLAKIGAEIARNFPGDEFKGFSQRRYISGLITSYRERNTKPEAYAAAVEQQKQKFLEDKNAPKAAKTEKVENVMNTASATKTRKAAPMSKANQLRALQEEIALEERAKAIFLSTYGKEPKEDSKNDKARLAKIMELLKEGKENANVKAGLATLNAHIAEKTKAATTKRVATLASKKVSALQKPVAEMTACELCELEKAQADPSQNPELMARLAQLRAKTPF